MFPPRRGTEKRDELAAVHSMTSSAMASSRSGMSLDLHRHRHAPICARESSLSLPLSFERLLNEAPNCFRTRRAVVLIGNPCVKRLHLIGLYADADQLAFPCRRGAGFFPLYPCYHRLTFS
jgi:hypothetical protein